MSELIRTLFIKTEDTPNPYSLKFIPDVKVLDKDQLPLVSQIILIF